MTHVPSPRRTYAELNSEIGVLSSTSSPNAPPRPKFGSLPPTQNSKHARPMSAQGNFGAGGMGGVQQRVMAGSAGPQRPPQPQLHNISSSVDMGSRRHGPPPISPVRNALLFIVCSCVLPQQHVISSPVRMGSRRHGTHLLPRKTCSLKTQEEEEKEKTYPLKNKKNAQ